ncbi:unnamed protein product [Chrysoparadoxa australica]
MKKGIILLVAGLTLVACNKEKKVSLSNDELKTFYTVGHTLGERLKNLELSDEEVTAVSMGLRDAAMDKEPQVKTAEYRIKIQKLFQERVKKNADKQKNKGKEFLAAFSKEKDVVTTESGLAYKILSEGKGDFPKETDEVKVHYHGTLIDGTVFDSSKERGEPVTFPLNRVIKGWTEGVQKVKEGGKIKLVIPPELAYGDQGAPPKIAGGSTLVFEVELLSIVKPEDKKEAPKKK